ncbi:MAG: hypothetical protein OXP28_09850 [Gammaproteobacteria bacterium]|nr:hypothetical protein [Gammaproteobacteria bacterium]MDE0225426.1 hypothetical protein [Gammaproteobacteria bacterium]
MKSLTVAGFSDSQAEAVVETAGTAIDETLATKADYEAVFRSIKADLEYVMSTMVTKTDLAAFEQRMTIKFGAMAFAGMSLLAVLQKVL